MRIFGFEISRTKANPSTLLPVTSSRNSVWMVIQESFAGAWQRNEELHVESGLANPTLFRCVSLIATDVAKMRVRLVQQDANGIWTEVDVPAFSPLLRKPNDYQNRIQFFTSWMQSKLLHGNTYALKVRDQRNVVSKLYVLDPCTTTPLVSPSGDVFYRLGVDYLSDLTENGVVVPASEIIHDRINTFFHPLVGLSPIFACGLAALQGLKIARNSTKFFGNGARPAGILSAPGAISDETAKRLKENWDTNYGGENVGKTAVLGDGLKYESIAMNAVDAELVKQLQWTDEKICAAFGVPAYMAGVGTVPVNNNAETLREVYYGQCVQQHIESVELCLDEGLELPKPYGTEFDLDDLLRMDTSGLVTSLKDAVGAAILAPDEARKRMNYGPVPGGKSPLAQQQNFSLSALAKRDAKPDPFATTPPPAPTPPAADNPPPEPKGVDATRVVLKFLKKAA